MDLAATLDSKELEELSSTDQEHPYLERAPPGPARASISVGTLTKAGTDGIDKREDQKKPDEFVKICLRSALPSE